MKEDTKVPTPRDYAGFHGDIIALLESARSTATRSVNAVMTATYWQIGRRIVEFEQGGQERAEYRQSLLKRLSSDLAARFGRGFSVDNLELMRQFYVAYPPSGKSETLSRKSSQRHESWKLARPFPLSWSHYVLLVRSTRSPQERGFYEDEALRGGWSVRQLGRQIDSQFYTRALLSRNKRSMLERGAVPLPGDLVTADEAIKDPFVLEFLNLKDEYSESQLEEALILRLEDFMLELGGDFTFVGRQRRLRIGDTWFRVDLLFFHRRLRCLVIVDLKLGEFNHADVGQMHMYCNYAREHWTFPGENPPVGLVLCARHNAAVARYALDGLPNKVMAAEYHTVLPDEKLLASALQKTLDEHPTHRALTATKPTVPRNPRRTSAS
ncbi:PDDEXK nuclease domain-containing protein [Ramlibacter albus]|uniref:DUF1016 domain-containing protein n=1 Tax=Ramlibacter albus TaxID=2079448 RepID=A0A923M7F2_9BURK|nr:PDDEXK nuclease domain-containing protein [Ramlibacter albus]MBC5765136.1 DUF1016 domain-containing protein [Ramlibacter albus]